MPNSAFKRVIHVSDLFRDVHKWMDRQNNAGFVKLSPDLCELFALADPQWAGEGDWLDAMDQYVYVEFLVPSEKGGGGGVTKVFSLEELQQNMGEISLNIRSTEDDFCIEMLVSDIMVRYCTEESAQEAYWSLVIKETGILIKLYLLNKRTEREFWNDLLSLNKTLGVINEKPRVRYCLNDKTLMTLDYSPNMFLPVPQTNDFVEIPLDGKLTKLFVEERTVSYNHPLGKMGDIAILLFR